MQRRIRNNAGKYRVPIPHHEKTSVHSTRYLLLTFCIQYCTENILHYLMRTCSMSGSIFNSIRLCLRRAVSFWDLKEEEKTFSNYFFKL